MDPARLSALSLTLCPSPWPRAKPSSLGMVTMDADAATAAAAMWRRSPAPALVSAIAAEGGRAAAAPQLEMPEGLRCPRC